MNCLYTVYTVYIVSRFTLFALFTTLFKLFALYTTLFKLFALLLPLILSYSEVLKSSIWLALVALFCNWWMGWDGRSYPLDCNDYESTCGTNNYKGVKRDIEKYSTCGCPKSILALSGALGPGQNCQIWWFENLGINFVPSELQVCTWERQLPGNPSSHERLCRLPQTCSTPPPVVNAQKTRQGFRPAATAQCKLSNSKFGILFQLFQMSAGTIWKRIHWHWGHAQIT